MDITLALGGGGVRGIIHVGVIRGLEREGFKIKAVAGTSFGGVVAVFYALGYSPDMIEEEFRSVDQHHLFGHIPEHGPSLLGIAGVSKWLKDTIGERSFKDLKIPCILTATDLNSSREVLISEGKLVPAILATIAIPGVFPSWRMNGCELVDGATVDPVPVTSARRLFPKFPVVAVALSDPIGLPAQPWNIPLPNGVPQPLKEQLSRTRYAKALDVFLRSMDIITRTVTENRLQEDHPEIILRPIVVDISIFGQVDVHVIIKRGEQSVEKALPELKNLFTWQSRFRRRFQK
jgi:NTE family protein